MSNKAERVRKVIGKLGWTSVVTADGAWTAEEIQAAVCPNCSQLKT